MAKQDKRRRSELAKSATQAARIERASVRRRIDTWSTAAAAAASVGKPLNIALHITWSALMTGDLRDGHILGLGPVERERQLWAALRPVAARAGVPWHAMRGPEYDKQRGLHLHIVLHLPTTAAMRDAIATVERLTGAPAERTDIRGWSMRGLGRQHRGVIAVSACRGWLMQRHIEAMGGDGIAIAAYAAKSAGKAAVEGQHRLSHELSALVKQQTAAQRGVLSQSGGGFRVG